MPSAPGAAVHPVRPPAAEVGASAEMLTLGAQDDGAHFRRIVVALQHIGDLRHHIGIDEVVRTAPDLDRPDHAGLHDTDMLVTGHGSLPSPFRRIAPRATLPVGRGGGNGHGKTRSGWSVDPLRGAWARSLRAAVAWLQRD